MSCLRRRLSFADWDETKSSWNNRVEIATEWERETVLAILC